MTHHAANPFMATTGEAFSPSSNLPPMANEGLMTPYGVSPYSPGKGEGQIEVEVDSLRYCHAAGIDLGGHTRRFVTLSAHQQAHCLHWVASHNLHDTLAPHYRPDGRMVIYSVEFTRDDEAHTVALVCHDLGQARDWMGY